jgi:hypothetical protein
MPFFRQVMPPFVAAYRWTLFHQERYAVSPPVEVSLAKHYLLLDPVSVLKTISLGPSGPRTHTLSCTQTDLQCQN